MEEKWKAWLAGIYEGEGTVWKSKRGVKTFQLRIGMADEDIINRINSLVGFGKIYLEEKKPPLKSIFHWQLSKGSEIRSFLEIIYPYLGERRRKKADEVIKCLNEPKSFKPIKQHGTIGGYRAHYYRKEKPCESCKNAHKQYMKTYLTTQTHKTH